MHDILFEKQNEWSNLETIYDNVNCLHSINHASNQWG